MRDRFAGIVEVATASKARVNLFLDAGYRLLGIKQQAALTRFQVKDTILQMPKAKRDKRCSTAAAQASTMPVAAARAWLRVIEDVYQRLKRRTA